MHIKICLEFNIINFGYLIIQKAVFKKIIDQNIEKIIFVIKIIDLNIKVFVKQKIIILVFKIDSNNIYKKMALIDQDTIILF